MKRALLAIASVSAFVVARPPSNAHPRPDAPDSVVVRITAPDTTPVAFSGVILTNDAAQPARRVTGRTPYSVSFLASEVQGSFRATDGRMLGGEIVGYQHGARAGQSRGTSVSAFVMFYRDGRVGFSGF